MASTPYRLSAPKPPEPPDPYLVAWARLRRRRTVFWSAFLGWLPLSFVIMPLGDRWVPFLMFPLMGVIQVSSLMMTFFHCPHCGELFARRSWWWSSPDELFVRRCKHCGIYRGTPKSAAVRLAAAAQR